MADIHGLPRKLLKPYYKNGKINANKVAIDLIPFMFIFYFVNKYLQGCVASGQADWLEAGVKGFALVFQTRPYFFPSLQSLPFWGGIIAGVLFKFYMNARKKNAKKFRHGKEYGEAKWGKDKDFEPYTDPMLLRKSSEVCFEKNTYSVKDFISKENVIAYVICLIITMYVL